MFCCLMSVVVKKYAAKWGIPVKSIAEILDHVEFFKKNFTKNLDALELALKALKALTDDLLLRLQTRNRSKSSVEGGSSCSLGVSNVESLESVYKMFEKWFKSYVRVRDALMYVTSGECRHRKDIREAETSRFKSQLLSMSVRDDGYTREFKGEHYSGVGWDEFYNETVGIRKRLVDLLSGGKDKARGESRSRKLLSEDEFTCFENRLRETDTDAKNIAQPFKEGVKSHFRMGGGMNGTVELTSQDKHESLKVSVKTETGEEYATFKVQRRAKNFQLDESVLPQEWDLATWKGAMSLDPPAFEKKKDSAQVEKLKRTRKVIDDEDDEKDESFVTGAASAKNLGLGNVTSMESTVTIEKRKSGALQSDLSEIKIQCDVDPEMLQKSRDNLEKEKRGEAVPYAEPQAEDIEDDGLPLVYVHEEEEEVEAEKKEMKEKDIKKRKRKKPPKYLPWGDQCLRSLPII